MIKGYYKDTLKDLDAASIVFVFEDADLPSSVRDCLRHLWPRLQDGCFFYCHEPWSVPVVSLFYDERFWRDCLESEPPGFIGAGNEGTISMFLNHSLGYAKKINQKRVLERGTRVMIAGSKDQS